MTDDLSWKERFEQLMIVWLVCTALFILSVALYIWVWR